MFRKSYIFTVMIIAVVAFGGISAFGQTAATSGKVELVKEDGSREPVAGALIEVYRTDVKTGFPSNKTNKKGEFAFAGLMLGATYALSVSAPNCSPKVFPGVKAGQEKLIIAMQSGDGRKLSEAEVRDSLANPSKAADPGTSTATKGEKSKEQLEYEAKVAEIKAKNEKAAKNYDEVIRLLKEGAEAVNAKNYDLAVAKYDEGITIEPNYVGSTPVLLNNRGTSLRLRAVERYNKSVKLADVSEKIAGFGAAKKDLLDAANSHMQAWKMATEAPATEIKDPVFNDANKLNATREIKEAFRISVATEQVDPEIISAAKVMIPEYIKLEQDAAKKAEAMLIMADLYRVAGDSVNAIVEYKKILEATPESADALAGVGLSLVNEGYVKDDKAMLQEAANYLQKFVSVAPDTHKYKANAIEAIATLKSLSNVAPQKGGATPKKKP